MNLKKHISEIDGFPKEGIKFKDVTSLIANAETFSYTVNKFADFGKEVGANVVIGPEARGFIFGCPVAYAMNIGFVPVRKSGKLPREVLEKEYSLEYGTNTLGIHKDDIKKGDKVLIVDDLLATGGTIKASIELVEALGAEVVGLAFLIELKDLKGIKELEKFGSYNILILESY